MKITSIQTGFIKIPLKKPFKTALRSVDAVHDVLVKVETDEGYCGYGEAPPTAVITGDTHGSIIEAIEQFIAPAIVGQDLADFDAVMARLHKAIVGNTSAKAAVDMALYDIMAQSCGKPLYRYLGGTASTLETDITISVNPIDVMVEDSIAAVQEGYRILKVKVGKEGLHDVQRIAAIREAVGQDVVIRVDANQGWTAKESVRIIRAMEDKGLDIELVEQPVPAHDFEGMCFVTQNVLTPILADESVFSAADAVNIVQRRAADLLNIKLMKTGGIHEALRICAVAESYNVSCMIGCMLESKISVSAAAHLAGAKGIITMADLDGPALCKQDPYTGGPLYEGHSIVLLDNPGIGITQVPGFIN